MYTSSRMGPWIHYALPIPINAGSKGRGWSFKLAATIPPVAVIPAALRPDEGESLASFHVFVQGTKMQTGEPEERMQCGLQRTRAIGGSWFARPVVGGLSITQDSSGSHTLWLASDRPDAIREAPGAGNLD